MAVVVEVLEKQIEDLGNQLKRNNEYLILIATANSILKFIQSKFDKEYVSENTLAIFTLEDINIIELDTLLVKNAIVYFNLAQFYKRSEYYQPAKYILYLSYAAILGSIEACFQLGLSLIHGRELQVNSSLGIPLIYFAANQGMCEAEFQLAELYFTGYLVQKDDKKAFYYYAKAANNNHPAALHQLGLCLALGHGTKKDFASAKICFIEVKHSRNIPGCRCALRVSTVMNHASSLEDTRELEKRIFAEPCKPYENYVSNLVNYLHFKSSSSPPPSPSPASSSSETDKKERQDHHEQGDQILLKFSTSKDARKLKEVCEGKDEGKPLLVKGSRSKIASKSKGLR